MNEQLVEELVSKSYTALGIPRDKLRITDHAQARAAVAVALNKYFPQSPIAEALDVDRSTISRYRSRHSINLEHWGGYSKVYNIAEDLVDSKIYSEVTQVNIKTATKEIKRLERNLRRLKNDKKDLQGTVL